MIILRFLSILAGALVLFVAPLLLLPSSAQRLPTDGSEIILACVSIVLFASGFLFVGAAGHRLRRSLWRRLLAGVLLVIPILEGIWMLLFTDQLALLSGMAPFLCFAVFLFIAFIYPAARERSHRPMRPRETADAEALSLVTKG